MTVAEFSDFISYNPWAYLWFGAMGLGLVVITFYPFGKSKTKQGEKML